MTLPELHWNLQVFCVRQEDGGGDMLEMLLTKKSEAASEASALDLHLHDEVELLLENYVRVLNRTYNDVLYLQYRLASKQELAAIALDVYRNTLLRIELHLSLAGMGVGFMTVVAGTFGMNLNSGLEEVNGLFWPAAAGCVVGGVGVYLILGQVIKRAMLDKHTANVKCQQQTLQSVIRDIGILDVAIGRSHRLYQGKVDKQTFQKIFQECVTEYNSKATQAEMELAFQLLDDSGDGMLDTNEMLSFTDPTLRMYDEQSIKEGQRAHAHIPLDPQRKP